MDAFETEEQQADAIKKWFQENGKSLFTTILIVATCVLGFKYWRHHQEVVKIEASEHYMALMMSQMQKDEPSAVVKANTLMSQYPKTPYAQLAGLFLAKSHVEKDELDEAIVQLEWVMNHSPVMEFSLIARARAARIYMGQNQYDKALALLDIKDADGFLPVLEELKGDIYLSKEEPKAALEAYQLALATIQSKNLENPLLKLKLQELGGVAPEVDKEYT